MIVLSLLKRSFVHLVPVRTEVSGEKIKVSQRWTIAYHHECPCRIEISHPRGQNFIQGQGLPSCWLNSDPEGEISLSYMNRLKMDCFSPTFPRFYVGS